MIVYTFDRTLDGLLTAVFDAFAFRQQPEILMGEGGQLPLFCEEVHRVETDGGKARRVWVGLEKRQPKEVLRMIAVSFLSECPDLYTPLFRYICKMFGPMGEMQGRKSVLNYADPDVLAVNNIARKVMHEQLHMKQFIRFQKAKDGTYLAVVSPDYNVLPLITDHFQDRFGDQSWLIYDARRRYGYFYDQRELLRVTFQDADALPFDTETGRLSEELLSENDHLFQDLWRTYFKAICIRERMNPKKQLNDMPRRYWKYMTEKQ